MFFKEKESEKSRNEAYSKISQKALKSLSRSNVKNKYKDYLIYFVTLTFGICLLYTFNTIDKQFQSFGNNEMLMSYLYTAQGIIFGASIIISIIFAFLVNYANQFLMRRRKKEFGIYICLGMNKRDLTKLMYKESLIIGTLALIVGVVIGIFAEQGISIITTNMLGITSSGFKFSISILALIKTVVLFIIVIWFINKFNRKTIEKYKLIELLKDDKKNEFIDYRSKKANLGMFLGAIVLIGVGYIILIRDTISFKIIGLSITMIAVGTYLFFKSVSDFLIKIGTKRKSFYFKNLNMFTISQITNRIKSMNLTMTFICLLLCLSMTIIPSGLAISEAILADLNTATPYDATISDYIYKYDITGRKLESIKETLIKNGFPFKGLVSNYSEVKAYNIDGLTLNKLGIGEVIKKKNVFKKINLNEDMYLVSLSDYNNARVQQGLSKVTLNDGEYLVNNANKVYNDVISGYLKNRDVSLDINGFTLKNKIDNVESVNYKDSAVLSTSTTLVVEDKVLSNLEPKVIYLNVNYPALNNEYDNKFLHEFRDYKNDNYNLDSKIVICGEKLSVNTTLSYISIYMGIIFLIAAGAILALQQLVEQSLNIERYELLKRLGVRDKYREKAIFTQVLVVFVVPFVIALLHSIVINGAMHYMIIELLTANDVKNLLITIGTVIAVYGTYFLVSYSESKNTLLN